ncbi:MAG: hypothetical protein KBT39_11145 [Bacteroidales bacterium]|nr:hypothetical protein [Bacteroidales bacterium]
MKKNYIIPSQRVHVLDTKECLLADSQLENDAFDNTATTTNFTSDANQERGWASGW